MEIKYNEVINNNMYEVQSGTLYINPIVDEYKAIELYAKEAKLGEVEFSIIESDLEIMINGYKNKRE